MDIRKYFKIIPKNEPVNEVINEPVNEYSQLSDSTIYIFVDGSVYNNGIKGKAYGGMGIFVSDNHSLNRSIKLDPSEKISNNVAEIKACIEAIKLVKDTYKKIIIYSDSQYTINCITKWAKLWQHHGWQRRVKTKMVEIKNKELIIELYNLYNKYDIRFIHVRSHQKEPNDKNSIEYYKWYGNDMADKLAKNINE